MSFDHSIAYLTTQYTVASNRVSIIIGKPVLKNLLNDISFPDSSARPAATTLADAPMMVPLPPKQAPNANAHAKGPNSKPSVSSDANSITTVSYTHLTLPTILLV